MGSQRSESVPTSISATLPAAITPKSTAGDHGKGRLPLPSSAFGTPESPASIAVLVVDDDADMRRYVRRALRHMEARVSRVIEAGDGEEAIQQLQQEQVGLVISDVVMPVMDGYALSRAIRDTTPPAEMPILLITGEDTPREAADRARNAGAQAVLQKPFNAHSLCRAVEAVLDGDAQTQ